MNRKWLSVVGAVAFVGCSQNEAFVQSASSDSEDSVKSDDVQSALSALPRAEVLMIGRAGTPTFIRGNLGKVDTAVNQLAASSPDFQTALAQVAPVFRLDPSQLQQAGATSDELGSRHLKFQQVKNGLRVVGGELSVHVNSEGVIYAAHGNARDGISLTSVPAIDANAAQAKSLAASTGVSSAAAGKGQLVYFIDPDGLMSLAFETQVTGFKGGLPVRDLVYVNARTGALLASHPQIHSALNRKLYTAKNTTTTPGTLVRSEGGAAASDAIINTNYDRLGDTHKCYKDLFNRDSFDNAGAALISTIHYDVKYVNAYWDGTQMVYGDGDGVNADNLAKSMDVTAHELTHAVTERTANLTYSGESGGLNESMSDVFGNVCEEYRDGVISANTWMVGEDIWTPATPGDALRYLNDPKKDNYSVDTYADYPQQQEVHGSSGIGNLAFYMATMGGKHPRGRTTNTVRGLGITKTAKVWYRALTVYMQSSTTFAGARTAMTQAATDLYGSGDAAAIANAWAAVGVGAPVPDPGSGDGGTGGGAGGGSGGGTGGGSGGGTGGGSGGGTGTDVVLTNSTPVSGLSGATGSNVYFTLEVPAGQTTLSFTTSGGTGDADLYVQQGSRPTTTSYTCRPFKSGNAETCAFTNPVAGTWYVLVNGFSAYTGMSIAGTYGTGSTGPIVLGNGTAVTGIAGSSNSVAAYKITVPSSGTLTVTISGGTGDADLYVRKGAAPTTTVYDCRPYKAGNVETCTLSATSGDYFINVRGYSAFAGVTLKASY